MLFVGDSIFMPDFGTARCDFPGGSAQDLYSSAQRLLQLPKSTKVFVGHDYGPGGRPIAWETTIEKQKKRIFILITAFKFRSLSQYEKHGMLGSVYLR